VPGAVTGGLSLRSVTLIRGRQAVVRCLDWDAPPGVISRVEGENGSGKSTLLAAMAGRVAPAAGSIHLGRTGGRGPEGVVRYHPGLEPPPEVTLGDWLRLVNAVVPAGTPPDLIPELPRCRRLGQLSTGSGRGPFSRPSFGARPARTSWTNPSSTFHPRPAGGSPHGWTPSPPTPWWWWPPTTRGAP